MKKYVFNQVILLLTLSVLSSKVHSQVIVKDTLPPAFEWSLHLFDIPFMGDAAKAEAIRAGGGDLPQTVTPEWFGPLLIGLFYRRLNIHKSFALNLS